MNGTPDDDEPLWSSQPDQDPASEADTAHDHLYAVLNLPRDCSEEDIQRSYKRLAGQLLPPALRSARADPRVSPQRSSTRTDILNLNTRPPLTARSRTSKRRTRSSQTRNSAPSMTRWARRGSRQLGRSDREGRRRRRCATVSNSWGTGADGVVGTAASRV